MDIVVVGGGVAGLAAAWALTRARLGRVALLEREPYLFAHASGKNAAIYRPAETHRVVAELALRSAELLDELHGARRSWLRRDGLLLTGRHRHALESLATVCASVGVACERLERDELVRQAPVLHGGDAEAGLWVPSAGVVDLHGVATELARQIRAGGGTIELGCRPARVVVESGRAIGVETAGRDVQAEAVVVAGGAWAEQIGRDCGAPLPLAPMRRHIAQLVPDVPLEPTSPTVWDVELGAYFRPESDCVLASPGDATPWPAEDPPSDPAALELLWERLERMAPSLAQASVRRCWACLRTFAPDHLCVVGADPRLRGLFWAAGLGGHGMTAGIAAGEVLAACVAGREHAHAAALAPSRLLHGVGPPSTR